MTEISNETLREFVAAILDGGQPLESMQGPVLHYGLFLRKILNSERPQFVLQRDSHVPSQTPSGAAITPWHAAACMEDRIRTAAFIRGSIQAVDLALERFPHRPLHLVEAGCGPLGTLVLPLLAHFSRDELEVSLIDLHDEAIQCMALMLDHFGFRDRVRQLICGDVATVSLNSAADVVLLEVMNVALYQEPQVEITRLLMRNHRGAILVPQSIRIDLAMVNLVREFGEFPPRAHERQFLGTVFELNHESAIELNDESGFLPAGRLRIPDDGSGEFVPCLLTTIQVSDDVKICDYQSQISYPLLLCQGLEAERIRGEEIAFTYRLGTSPGLSWHVVNGNE